MIRITVMLIAMMGLMNGEPRCQKTKDLVISGTIVHDEENEAKLRGSVYNKSDKTNYENILVKADFFDARDEKMGEFTFTLKEEAEGEQSVPFNIEIAHAREIDSVAFNVVCAEKDEGFLGL